MELEAERRHQTKPARPEQRLKPAEPARSGGPMRSSVLQAALFLTIAAFAIAPAPARAQSIAEPDTWTVTPLLGFSFGTNALGGSLGLGAGIAYDWTANLGFEGEFGHLFDVAGDTNEIDWSVTTFSGNAVYHFDVLHVTPYATAGLGVERSGVDVQVPNPVALVPPSSTEIMWNFGGGAKYKLNNRMIVRADLRRFQANDDAPDFWRLYGGMTFTLRP
jgi:opacity protein-like surface antigen